ncbi:MAG: hypothetical protein JW718_01600 [Desulfovibrionaceae bacterium]|nr:hypothetical protein [Desulfovibrionaceae bacterium]
MDQDPEQRLADLAREMGLDPDLALDLIRDQDLESRDEALRALAEAAEALARFKPEKGTEGP